MRKHIALFIVLSLVIALFVGCSSGSSKPEGKPTDAPKGQTPDTKAPDGGTAPALDPVIFAVVGPGTGDSAEYGRQFRYASDIAAEKINASGGINGRELILEFYDCKNDPKESTEIARKLGQDKRITAVIGDFSSSSCMAAAPIYEEAGLCQVSPGASNPAYAAMGEYSFGTVGLQQYNASYLAQTVCNSYLEAKNAAVIYLNNDWGVSSWEAFKAGAEECDLEILAVEPVVVGEQDFSAILAKIRQTNPDILVILTTYSECASCVNKVRQMGWDVPIAVAEASACDQFLEIVGEENAEGVFSNAVFVVDPNDAPSYEFALEFEKRSGSKPAIHGVCAHDTTLLVAEACRACGDNLTRSNLRDTLANFTGFVGLVGPIEFDKDGAVRRQYKVITVEDGKWVAKTDYDYR